MLTPSEIIRLGIEQGHSADVIVASLEAAGWVIVPREPTEAMTDSVIDDLPAYVTDALWSKLIRASATNSIRNHPPEIKR